ncbi:alpha/beta hydrolase fold-3 domain-containing protein [Bimuria novae-zelandiae CBS 107.79]|uniref:Alpha/beta hydrolase fold-3 domain-containing protein n=1 Tax=Bimuria novae-zelandiae CBS 107.79 TaxID=1447943 RepID=A0A6A5VW55_9PLEO|nr:alpha/beta hydrolase fold-3 domain-containing protein [Bimuria novae-zelandiae CBS 107.79]
MSDSVYLDPLNQAVADQLATEPPIADLTVPEFRAFFERVQQHEPIPGVTRTNFTVPFEDGVEAFVFKADGAATNELPVIFYLHGGGWKGGNVNIYDSICRELALQTGYAVVFPEYTLAPEARYPTQQEQCYATVKYVSEHGHEHGLSREKFAIVGDSAGGQLAVATTLLASTRNDGIKFGVQVLLHPITDTVTSDRDTPSAFHFFNGPFNTVPFMRGAIDTYIPIATDRESELASPQKISAEHAAKQPPTLIISSAVDVLRDDGLLFGEILQKAGVDCAVVVAHGQLHVSLVLEATRKGPTPRAMMRLVATKIKETLS